MPIVTATRSGPIGPAPSLSAATRGARRILAAAADRYAVRVEALLAP